jgi:hypothetical protein
VRTGADLKRLVNDATAMYAYELLHGKPLQRLQQYMLSAVEDIRKNKQQYSRAHEHVRNQRPQRPAYFDVSESE